MLPLEIYICADFSRDSIELLRLAGHTVRTGGWGFSGDIAAEDELISQIGAADVLVAGYEEITEKVLNETGLKAIFSIRGGPRANIDVDCATRMGIPVFYTVGREAVPVADFTMGQILSLTRKITRTDRELRRGVFAAPHMAYGSEKDVIWDMTPEGPWQARKGAEMQGRTLGLIGFGSVGTEVAKRAAGFGMNVIAYDPYISDEYMSKNNAKKCGLDQLMRAADIISLHAKVTDANKGMLDGRAFSLMKDGVYLVNNARAGLIDEQAMRDALRSGKLGGLALDVFHKEPISGGDELFDYDNVIVTPHIAGSGLDAIYLQSVMITNDIMFYAAGGRPRVIANPEVYGIVWAAPAAQ